jgi:hypothetical protein
MSRNLLYLSAFAYLLVALCQIPASVQGIHQLTGFWWPICTLGALLVGSAPVLGTTLAIVGAQVWGWGATACYAFFLGVPLFFISLSSVETAIERLVRKPAVESPRTPSARTPPSASVSAQETPRALPPCEGATRVG